MISPDALHTPYGRLRVDHKLEAFPRPRSEADDSVVSPHLGHDAEAAKTWLSRLGPHCHRHSTQAHCVQRVLAHRCERHRVWVLLAHWVLVAEALAAEVLVRTTVAEHEASHHPRATRGDGECERRARGGGRFVPHGVMYDGRSAGHPCRLSPCLRLLRLR